MPVLSKEIELSPIDIFHLLQQLSSEEKIQLLTLCEEGIEMDAEHNLPKSFVQELKSGLEEVKKGNTEPFDYQIYE